MYIVHIITLLSIYNYLFSFAGVEEEFYPSNCPTDLTWLQFTYC